MTIEVFNPKIEYRDLHTRLAGAYNTLQLQTHAHIHSYLDSMRLKNQSLSPGICIEVKL